MSTFNVSRRQLVSLLGLAAVVVPCGSAVAAPRAVARPAPAKGGGKPASDPAALLAPLHDGSKLGPWQLQAISAVHAGAVTVRLRDARGRCLCVDICARDDAPGALLGPARTARHDLFLANECDGERPTHEDHGLATMALAEIIRTNEHGVQLEGMLTLRDRLRLHRDLVGQKYRNG